MSQAVLVDDAAALFRSLISERAPSLEVREDALTRSQYAYDASNYRVPPAVVVRPRSDDELCVVVQCARLAGLPLTARGSGTSMAGNAVGRGAVVDLSRHMNRVIEIRPSDRTAVVQAGARLATLQTAAAAHGLMFAPDPSSGSRVTVGGMLGNDACGNHSVAYGRTSDHVLSLRGVLADGSVFEASAGGITVKGASSLVEPSTGSGVGEALADIVTKSLGAIRLELGRIPRQVSGYHLHRLLPENGFDVAKMLVGSEGTLAVVTEATLRLVPRPVDSRLVVIGYPDLEVAAADVPTILAHGPSAIEAMDHEILAAVRDQGLIDRVGELPAGSSWLYVEVAAGESFVSPSGVDAHPAVDLASRIDSLLADLTRSGRSSGALVVDSEARRAALWRVREDGAGLIANPPGGPRSVPGWEDAAVAPDALADYIAGYRSLLAQYGLRGVVYGHFGAGCVHTRIDFDLTSEGGRASMRGFVEGAADLVSRLGGSVSGEHGDGRSRSELLHRQYSPALMQAFAEVKAALDPTRLLNPGIIVEPVSLTADLLPVPAVGGSFGGVATDAARCIGVGRCVVDGGTGGMCPSYRVTREESDSTRGRARALLDLAAEPAIDAASVLGTLDQCLSCKACATDCPTGVDIATAKAEFLDEYYRGRLRPRTHYTLSWLPVLTRLGQPFARIVNSALDRDPVRRAASAVAGVAPERRIPRLATRRETRSALSRLEGPDSDVLLFVDTFTRRFQPEVIHAAVDVLSSAGLRVGQAADGCCAVPWISSGQLRVARRVIHRTVAALDEQSTAPILVLEPSCAAALVDETVRLAPGAPAARVAARIMTFDTALSSLAPEWVWPAVPEQGLVQQHCHERSVLSSGEPASGLRRAGMRELRAPQSCCGMAGTFGFEAQHYAMSQAVADLELGPALADLPEDAPVVADGFGCRVQLADMGRPAVHTAQLLAAALPAQPRTS